MLQIIGCIRRITHFANFLLFVYVLGTSDFSCFNIDQLGNTAFSLKDIFVFQIRELFVKTHSQKIIGHYLRGGSVVGCLVVTCRPMIP